jgi:hypothetical protein
LGNKEKAMARNRGKDRGKKDQDKERVRGRNGGNFRLLTFP